RCRNVLAGAKIPWFLSAPARCCAGGLPSLLTAAEPERRTGKPAAFSRAAMPRERLPNGRKQVQFGPLRSFPAEALRLSSLPGLFRSPPRCSASAPSRSFAGGQSDRIPAALGLMLARLSCYPL